ncbi:Lrp/AsnC family transcriptional regulator [Roseibium denhamense]|uniref:Lrp/AsnC family transcriptional regulator n=1 Tax=Roseibium denhamense TaxID=76305 RepID=A0ABY1NVR3_9HYPH|nr:Lrp/AsnC family transcriptional regulator [Roseibium denhamense]MTI04429.1 Lrp/AsnC family transcriptional regulator [Roseibium denhamense]SMP19694.1 Lrp/AsnC family transcriptional regulator [Roseibium denhamense]
MEKKFDHIDRALLRALQRDSRASQRDLADQVGLSQNACWRRLKALYESGLIERHTIRVDPAQLGLDLTVFVMVRTRHHSKSWLETFRSEVTKIPNVIDFYRLAGDYDYMLKVVVEDMNAFDRIYQRLIEKVDLDTVTSYMTMEAIADARDLPI